MGYEIIAQPSNIEYSFQIINIFIIHFEIKKK